MFSVKKSDIFILLHLSTTSGPQESNSMFFQRKGRPDVWIAVQNIWNFRKISQMLCTVIHRHNDERKTAVRWQKLHKSGTMDSLRKGVPAMAIKYTEEQLNSVDKSMLIQMFLNQQEQLEKVSANLHSLDTKMQAMMEQLILGNKNRFGRSSEKMEDTQQMRFIEVDEHHVGVYASKTDGHMVKAEHPKGLLHGSPVSASLAAAIMNGKYVNAVPLYRLEQEFIRYGLAITRQNMANWMIRLGEEYLSVLYDHLHSLLYGYHVIQADETPVLVNRDGRSAGSKSYMWVYRSGHMYPEKQIILYEYQRTRNTSHPREFLRDYSGICVTDGYQVYHTLEKEREDLIIAGCWVHARRRFDEALAVVPKESRKESASFLIIKQIQAIYREEGKLKELSSKERLVQRQVVVKPLVDALFVYLKQHESEVGTEKLRAAFTYALNQEKYLRVFLTDGDVPMDNNASERAIRGFCVGKKNWQMIDTINGAKSSAIIYSIAETAKANNLKPYEYFEYLLTEIPKHMDDTDRSFLNDLVPWSEKLPENIRKPKN